jgi:hypothetical protein
MMVALIPPGQYLLGNSAESFASQGAKPSPFPKHLWQMLALLGFLAIGSPAIMRNPGLKAVILLFLAEYGM